MSKHIEESYALARDIYASHGVNTEDALRRLASIEISLHAWQGDDVVGFEDLNHALTGGCQVTGNYPGRARTAEELRADLDMALQLLPGAKRVCLQGHQVDRMLPGRDRDQFSMANFSAWLAWAQAQHLALDIAPCFYSHPKLEHGLSLSHPDPAIRRFWIEHGKAIRRIGAEFGRVLGRPCVCNFWAPDGFKDTPADRDLPRRRLLAALDECFAEAFPESELLDAVEPKLFGIGTESCTIGSHDFYLTYAARRNKLICLDSGHFHPTESIADKISAICCQQGRILLHVSRGVRWDSDHVITLNDELLSIARESVAWDYQKQIYFCLDFFDASINRIAAWVIGTRNMQKALLCGLLEPRQELIRMEQEWDFTARLALQEESKALPWCAVWDEFCRRAGVPVGLSFLPQIRAYEQQILSQRS
ncbi:MAG: L-rhamnose isomerase [Oligosphaeraceae bacterium]|nr:L-rhamnose isomerase [Oligosphaeraceae bacterium]